jgi:putative copper resistance protein D
MLEAGLIVSRFLHYAALMALFGVSLFPFYAFPSRADAQPARLIGWMQVVLLAASVAALVTGILWLVFTTANMMGTLSAAADQDAVWTVLHDTAFGHLWASRLALSVLIIGVTGFRMSSRVTPRREVLTPLLAAALLATLAGVGHTQQNEGMHSFIHTVADGVHLLGAGAWLGGLLALALVLAPSGAGPASDQTDAENVLLRFSGMGYVAVAVLVASGVINTWYLVGSFAGLLGTPYGQLLLVKLCLFMGMLALAASNRFWLVPALGRESKIGHAGDSLFRLRRHVLGEEALGLFVLLIVGALGTMEPAVGQMSP